VGKYVALIQRTSCFSVKELVAMMQFILYALQRLCHANGTCRAHTAYIVYLADSADFKGSAFNKLSSYLTVFVLRITKRHHTRELLCFMLNKDPDYYRISKIFTNM